MSDMKKIVAVLLTAVLVSGLVSCSTGRKKHKKHHGGPQKTFMSDSRRSSRTQRKSFGEVMGEMRERKREERRRFQDVSRPYSSQGGSFRVYPWRESRSRSERLHETLRDGRGSSLF